MPSTEGSRRQPRGAPPPSAMRLTTEDDVAWPRASEPLSIERLDDDGTKFDREAEREGTFTGRWARWNRHDEHKAGPPRALSAFSSQSTSKRPQTASMTNSAVEEELAETRKLLEQYKTYVERTVTKEVEQLESEVEMYRKQRERNRDEGGRQKAVKHVGGRNGSRGGLLVFSESEESTGDSVGANGAAEDDRGRDRRTTKDRLSQLQEAGAERARVLESLSKDVADLKRKQKLDQHRNGFNENEDGLHHSRSGSPLTAANPNDAELSAILDHFLDTVANDGEQFTAALCRLCETLGTESGIAVYQSAARAAAAIHANWQSAAGDVRHYMQHGVQETQKRSPFSSPVANSSSKRLPTIDLPTVLSAIVHAQSQEHLHLVSTLQKLVDQNTSLARQLRESRVDATELRNTAAIRTSEIEEDHQAELEVLQGTIHELEARLLAATSAGQDNVSPNANAGHRPRQSAHGGGQLPAESLASSAPAGVGGGSCFGLSGKDAPLNGSFTNSGVNGAGVMGENGGDANALSNRAAHNSTSRGEPPAARCETSDQETQTPLSLEFISAALNRGGGGRLGEASALGTSSVPASVLLSGPSSPTGGSHHTVLTASVDRSACSKAARREREVELVEMLVAEVENLQGELAAVRAERNALEEQRDRFLCQVESPSLDYRRRLSMAGYLGNHTMLL